MNYIGSILNTFNQKYSFVIKEPQVQDYSSIWRLYKGKKDDLDISVFILDLQKYPEKREEGKNALKRIKTLKHPSILKFIDGVEEASQIIIATEEIQSLSINLKNQDNIVWGLWKIANVLQFLNQQGIIHGNLRISSIFCVASGEWKLSGLEYCAAVDIFMNLSRSRSDLHLPKEVFQGQKQAQKIDNYGFGVLIYEIFNGNLTRREDLVNRGKIPMNLYELCKRLLEPEVKRLDFGDFIELGSRKGGYFDNAIIKTSKFLEEINIKEGWEKEEFIRKIADSVNELPIEFAKYKVLPELLRAVEFGGAGANALNSTLKLGSKLNSEEFNSLILPTVMNLFSSQDKNIKTCLYENLESIISFIPDKIVNDKLFPSLATGFNDENPSVREQALKSVLHVAPKLNDRNINTELYRYLSKLQVDPQPGIRTVKIRNLITRIPLFVLGKLTQKRVLSQTFLRALGDPFPPARVAGLLAFSATTDYYEPSEVSSQILPVFSRLLIDPEKNVRDQAFKNMNIFLKILQTHSDSMPEVKRDLPTSQPVREGKAPNSQGPSWGDWALSTVSSKLAGAALDLEPSTSSMSAPSYSAPKVSPTLSSQSNSSFSGQPSTKSNGFICSAAAPIVANQSQNQLLTFNSASKPLVLSTKPKDGLEIGWDGWDDNPILCEPKLSKSNGSAGLGPVLQPERPKASSISKNASANAKELTMTGWSNGNDEWGWEDKTDRFPKQKKASIDASFNSNSKIVNDWNSASPGDDWNSWAEPHSSEIERFPGSNNDWGAWPSEATTSISIDKIKGENRKQKLQESKTKQSRIGGKNY